MKSARRLARELALQGLYQAQLSGNDEASIEAHLAEAPGYVRADRPLFESLLRGVLRELPHLRSAIEPLLDRRFEELSPVERSLLLLGTFELSHHLETPYRVIINEAVELAKAYGGTEGHKFVNGVLDKAAGRLRPLEVGEARDRPKTAAKGRKQPAGVDQG
jgi:N utilization substance protein B